MPNAKYTFPKQFLWGTATSSHQVEGSNTNSNWYEWEQQPGNILRGQISGLACDWWNGRWREDFNRAADAAQNTLRISLEWSRIQPTPNEWDESALDYYREMIRGLIQAGLQPLVTLHHFSDPLWFTEQGGWENQESPRLFLRYAEKVIPALKPLVSNWVTINEPNVYIFCGYLQGVFPPGKKRALGSAQRVLINMIEAHALVYHWIHEQQPEASVGSSINYHDFFPKTHRAPDRWLTSLINAYYNLSFVNVIHNGTFNYGPYRLRNAKAKGTLDFFGLNYYTGSQVHFSRKTHEILSFPAGATLSDANYIANEPESFARALRWAAGYGKPVVVTENGIENDEDSTRREYLADHMVQLWRAWSEGVPLRGYYHWTLVDNFEWDRGWTQPFGLWRLDLQTQKREKRESADFYAAICRKNSLDTEDIEHYAPAVFRRLFL